MTTEAPKDLIGFMNFYLVERAPVQLPDGVKEFFVKFGPWITVVLLVLSLPLLLVMLGLGTALMPFAGVGYAAGFGINTIVFLVQLGLTIAALPGLFARKMQGWTLMFYAEIVSVVFSVLNGAILGAIIGGLIWFYVLFQIRSKYN